MTQGAIAEGWETNWAWKLGLGNNLSRQREEMVIINWALEVWGSLGHTERSGYHAEKKELSEGFWSFPFFFVYPFQNMT